MITSMGLANALEIEHGALISIVTDNQSAFEKYGEVEQRERVDGSNFVILNRDHVWLVITLLDESTRANLKRCTVDRLTMYG